MKKICKKSLAALLVLVMALALCACGGAKVEGTWQFDYDATDLMNESLATSLGEDTGIDVDVLIPIVLTMNNDKTYTIAIETDAAADSLQAYMDALSDWFVDYVYSMGEDLGFSREEYNEAFQSQTGTSIDDYCKEVMSELDVQDMVSDLAEEESGTYKVTGNKLFFDNGEPCTFTLEGDTLTLENVPGLSDELDIDTMEFNRVK